jgi:hypothetical protein
LIDPVIEYTHPDNVNPDGREPIGLVVVGGNVYRGRAIPALEGRYIFGVWSNDFATPGGTLLAARPTPTGLWSFEELFVVKRGDDGSGELGHFLLGFGQDRAGEVYVCTTDNIGPSGTTGRVYKIVRPRTP